MPRGRVPALFQSNPKRLTRGMNEAIRLGIIGSHLGVNLEGEKKSETPLVKGDSGLVNLAAGRRRR